MTGHRKQYVEPITIDGILDWLERTVSALVDFPGCVRVQAMKGAQTTIFEVKVDPGDVRRLIGRKGRTAGALREILTNFGARIKMRCHLEILEPSHSIEEIPTLGAEE